MNAATPARPAPTWINRLAFIVSRAFPGSLHGLLGLGLIHGARRVVIRRGPPPRDLANDYMPFVGNVDGTTSTAPRQRHRGIGARLMRGNR